MVSKRKRIRRETNSRLGKWIKEEEEENDHELALNGQSFVFNATSALRTQFYLFCVYIHKYESFII